MSIEGFREIACADIRDNVFRSIGQEWMLVTAGTRDGFNTMTAGWGGWGVLWGKNVCFCFVRPSRHTFGFMEKHRIFTLSFPGEKHRTILQDMGEVGSS